MKRSAALARLRSLAEELRAQGVTTLYLFGSTARDEARQESDVDLFFDYDRSSASLSSCASRIESVTSSACNADVLTRDSLHPMLKERIEEAAVRVF